MRFGWLEFLPGWLESLLGWLKSLSGWLGFFGPLGLWVLFPWSRRSLRPMAANTNTAVKTTDIGANTNNDSTQTTHDSTNSQTKMKYHWVHWSSRPPYPGRSLRPSALGITVPGLCLPWAFAGPLQCSLWALLCPLWAFLGFSSPLLGPWSWALSASVACSDQKHAMPLERPSSSDDQKQPPN